ncbi:hypothetical protein B0J13DRAFT_529316 [Dactylonectria estremocensis]|uniref:Uncharacterized protein n=1 Tax=Dactylonectria estremocensis TaxID=1079267 RepID=A0A9P9E8P2_9HYPO|nr:hypothetical protein B0J13DRAFT_529316 [Dactylonectria estremocensis]
MRHARGACAGLSRLAQSQSLLRPPADALIRPRPAFPPIGIGGWCHPGERGKTLLTVPNATLRYGGTRDTVRNGAQTTQRRAGRCEERRGRGRGRGREDKSLIDQPAPHCFHIQPGICVSGNMHHLLPLSLSPFYPSPRLCISSHANHPSPRLVSHSQRRDNPAGPAGRCPRWRGVDVDDREKGKHFNQQIKTHPPVSYRSSALNEVAAEAGTAQLPSFDAVAGSGDEGLSRRRLGQI